MVQTENESRVIDSTPHSSDVADERPISLAVVDAVASVSNRPPVSATDGDDDREPLTPLYEAINPDALDSLVRSTETDPDPRVTVTFEYCGYEVTVESSGQVTVREA